MLIPLISILCVSHTSCTAINEEVQESQEWQNYIVAPSSASVYPEKVHSTSGYGVSNVDNILKNDGAAVFLTTAEGKGQKPTITIDFGREVSGYFEVGFLSSNSPILNAAFSESLEFLTTSGDYSANEEFNSKGRSKYRPGHQNEVWNDPALHGGFRYVQINLESEGWVNIDFIRLRFLPFIGTPDTFKGYFLSNDDLLNKIWYRSVYTVQLNTLPLTAVLDGPKRDRSIWSGDLPVEASVNYISFYDTIAVKNSLKILGDLQQDDGYVIHAAYPDPENRPVPGSDIPHDPPFIDYQAWWIIALYDYYLYAGDKSFIQEYYARLQRALEWLDRHTDANGLISQYTYTWRLGGFQGQNGNLHGIITYVNAVYFKALLSASEISMALGDKQQAALYKDKANDLREAINSGLWDPNKMVYVNGSEDPNIAQDGNVLAVLYGIASHEKANHILEYLKSHMWVDFGSVTVDNPNDPFLTQFIAPLSNYWEAQARFIMKNDTDGLNLIRKCWGHMVQNDPETTMWELMTRDGRPLPRDGSASLSHGWSAGAAAVLSSMVLGIEPLMPGFSRYHVIPHPGDLEWVEGRVPTPTGSIDVLYKLIKGRSFIMTVKSPAETSGLIGIPKIVTSPVIRINGKIVWQNSMYIPIDDVESAFEDSHYIYFTNVKSGIYSFTSGHE